MFTLRQGVIWTVAVPLIMLATSGCATKKYVSQQVKPVNTRVSQLEKTTNDKISYLNNKEQSDISQVNERISTTDQRVSQTAEAAQQAQGTASRAMEEVESSGSKIAANSSAIDTLGSGVANALNYQQVEKADVTFAYNKDTLTPEAKVALDMIASKVQSLPRAVVEVVGFADKSGSSPYNLALSRRRAEAVERYLVMQKVPLRSIHIVGLGGEAPPPGLVADEMEINPGAGKTQYSRLARRVHIRVFGAGDITQGSASRVQ
jgi:outer membrane protein OmpA-like peptidoglycan-associated protein